MLSREQIVEAFNEVYETSTREDRNFFSMTGTCSIDFALYIAGMARKDALEEAAKISDQYVSCELIGDKIRALKDKQ